MCLFLLRFALCELYFLNLKSHVYFFMLTSIKGVAYFTHWLYLSPTEYCWPVIDDNQDTNESYSCEICCCLKRINAPKSTFLSHNNRKPHEEAMWS